MHNKNDLEYPLYKYWIFYKLDESHCKKQIVIQKVKLSCLIIIDVINIFRYIFYLFQSEPNKLLPTYFCDILPYITPNKEVAYILCIALLNMNLILLIILNTSNKRDYKWFDIISAINGYQTFQSIGISDEIFVKKFINKIKLLYFFW